MTKKTKVSQEDIDDFYRALKGTKPLIQRKIRLFPKTSARKPAKKFKAREDIELEEAVDIEIVGPETFITYKQPSISNKTLRKLRKGQYNVDAKLDLHGMTVEEARGAVTDFLQSCLYQSMRVVLIVHGKGVRSNMPILKNKLNHWLRNTNAVLAFCSAGTRHGSRGATYVLLKRGMEDTV